MKPKYPKCENCGSSQYEIKSLNTLECEYCGTEYVIEVPERQVDDNFYGYVPILNSTIATSYFTGTVAIEKY